MNIPENKDWSVVAVEAFEFFAERKPESDDTGLSIELLKFYALMAIAQQLNRLSITARR